MTVPRYLHLTIPAALAIITLAPTGTADAFCGFYVSGAGGEMFNNATQVVLMREGTRTVLSMQNNYQGPPENFAMVVPVPEVLQEDNVKTLDKALFARIDSLAAPRLVEYWEQDPCRTHIVEKRKSGKKRKKSKAKPRKVAVDEDLGVTIEAQFTVGEYEIAILSAKDSTGLDIWLKREKYKIPDGAEPLLRPYVESGSKFFVAKVDTTKVKFENGMAKLSPLRFHYDSKTFSLPVRLGMINSSGTQDLIVHVLARNQRYQVANFPNVTIPTNLNVKDEVRTRFGEFYASLFDATLEKNLGAVVTEYSWDASTCDPCPTPALRPNELASLGADVLFGASPDQSGARTKVSKRKRRPGKRIRRPTIPWSVTRGFVLTRLHARYGKGSLADDLIFEAAPAIAGGREMYSANKIERGSVSASRNNFQGRYSIRHEWTGPITCENPRRGIWGGPPPGVAGSTQPQPALELAFAPRGKAKLASFVKGDIPELEVAASASAEPPAAQSTQANTATDTAPGSGAATGSAGGAVTSEPAKQKTSKGCNTQADPSPWLLALAVLALMAVRRRRSASRHRG